MKRVCLIHQDGWSGKDVEYYICDDCLEESRIIDYKYNYKAFREREV